GVADCWLLHPTTYPASTTKPNTQPDIRMTRPRVGFRTPPALPTTAALRAESVTGQCNGGNHEDCFRTSDSELSMRWSHPPWDSLRTVSETRRPTARLPLRST